jgi:lipooligosaccharide transport system permease protein
VLGNLSPLQHTVELIRHAVFGWDDWADLVSACALIGFGVLMWRVTICAVSRKLVD